MSKEFLDAYICFYCGRPFKDAFMIPPPTTPCCNACFTGTTSEATMIKHLLKKAMDK